MTSLTMPQRSDDRKLWFACAVAGLFHVALMFGLRIGIEPVTPTSLEVTLVATPESHSSLTARVLAPVAQSGRGNQRELRDRRSLPGAMMDQPGLRHANDTAMLSAQASTGTAEALSSTTAEQKTSRSQSQPSGSDESLQLLRQAQAGDPTPLVEQNPSTKAASDATLLAGASLGTRAAQQAAYREIWRQKVERAGSANFPWSALAMGQPKSLTLLVTVSADGVITQTRVLRSSGLPMLDRAALNILRIAGPFPPFDESLRREAAELSFAYKWEFFPGNRAALRVGRP